MKIHELSTNTPKQARRVGRGIASGKGKTAGRGTKGYGSRTGSTRKPGFEGGQNPLMQRLPKLRGFRSFKTAPVTVRTGKLELVKSTTIDNFSLAEAGLIASPYVRVKLIVGGDITKKYTVKLQAASIAAAESIRKAGGTYESIPQVQRASKKSEDN